MESTLLLTLLAVKEFLGSQEIKTKDLGNGIKELDNEKYREITDLMHKVDRGIEELKGMGGKIWHKY